MFPEHEASMPVHADVHLLRLHVTPAGRLHYSAGLFRAVTMRVRDADRTARLGES